MKSQHFCKQSARKWQKFCVFEDVWMPKITCSTEDVIKNTAGVYSPVCLYQKPCHVHTHTHLVDKNTVPTFPAKGELNSAGCEWHAQMRRWPRCLWGVWPFCGGSAAHRSGWMCRRCSALTWLLVHLLRACEAATQRSDTAKSRDWHILKKKTLGSHSCTNTEATDNRTVFTHQKTWCFLWSSSSSVCLPGAGDDERRCKWDTAVHIEPLPPPPLCVCGGWKRRVCFTSGGNSDALKWTSRRRCFLVLPSAHTQLSTLRLCRSASSPSPPGWACPVCLLLSPNGSKLKQIV